MTKSNIIAILDLLSKPSYFAHSVILFRFRSHLRINKSIRIKSTGDAKQSLKSSIDCRGDIKYILISYLTDTRKGKDKENLIMQGLRVSTYTQLFTSGINLDTDVNDLCIVLDCSCTLFLHYYSCKSRNENLDCSCTSFLYYYSCRSRNENMLI